MIKNNVSIKAKRSYNLKRMKYMATAVHDTILMYLPSANGVVKTQEQRHSGKHEDIIVLKKKKSNISSYIGEKCHVQEIKPSVKHESR
jgi:hypothetical protein